MGQGFQFWIFQRCIIVLNILTFTHLVDINAYIYTVSLFIAATKIDLRDDPSIKCYSTEEGKRLKRKVKAQSYKECSALNYEGLEEIFVEAIRVVLRYKVKKHKTECNIL